MDRNRMPVPQLALHGDQGPHGTLEQSSISASTSTLHAQSAQEDGNHVPLASALQSGPSQLRPASQRLQRPHVSGHANAAAWKVAQLHPPPFFSAVQESRKPLPSKSATIVSSARGELSSAAFNSSGLIASRQVHGTSPAAVHSISRCVIGFSQSPVEARRWSCVPAPQFESRLQPPSSYQSSSLHGQVASIHIPVRCVGKPWQTVEGSEIVRVSSRVPYPHETVQSPCGIHWPVAQSSHSSLQSLASTSWKRLVQTEAPSAALSTKARVRFR